MRLLALLAIFALPLNAQVLRLSGGDSSLLNASGGGATLYLPNYTDEFDIGLQNGHLEFGASLLTKWHGNFWTIGDRPFNFNGNSQSLFIAVRGVTVRHEAKHSRWVLFAGATGEAYTQPFVNLSNANHFGIGGDYATDLPHGFTFAGVALIDGSYRTALATGSYTHKGFLATAATGWLQNQAVLNGSVTERLSHVGFTAIRNDYTYQNLSSTIDSATVLTHGDIGDLKLHASASFFDSHSRYNGASFTSEGESLSAGAQWQWLRVTSSLYNSKFGDSITTELDEKVTRHLILREYLTEQGGRRSYNAGFDYHRNILSASVGYETFFYGAVQGKSPFQQSLDLSISLQLPHSTSANLQTYHLPNGATKFTAYAGTYQQVGNTVATQPSLTTIGRRGKFVMKGTVTLDGKPFEGAAIQIGKDVVFSDREGTFYLRTNKETLPVKLIPEEFSAPGDYEVVSCPDAVKQGTDLTVVVRRKRE